MDKIEIEKVDGKWLINGKLYKDATDEEQEFFYGALMALNLERELNSNLNK